MVHTRSNKQKLLFLTDLYLTQINLQSGSDQNNSPRELYSIFLKRIPILRGKRSTFGRTNQFPVEFLVFIVVQTSPLRKVPPPSDLSSIISSLARASKFLK